MNKKGVSDSKFRNVISDLCIFYETIHEYREVTENDTTNVTKAIHIVLNETYNDSCKWVRLDTFKITNTYCCLHLKVKTSSLLNTLISKTIIYQPLIIFIPLQLKEKLNSDYDCTDISSINVTEICTFVEAFSTTKGLLEVLNGDALKTPSGENSKFTIECENGNCSSVCALLGDGVCGCNNNNDTKSTLVCN